MIKQLLKIMMRNKTKNMLLLLQFSLSFIALYMLATKTISIVSSFTTDLGFETKNLVSGRISGLYGIRTSEDFYAVYPAMKQAIEELRDLDYIQDAGYLNISPFGGSNNNSNGNKINFLTPQALKAIGLKHISGEFFKKEDQFESNPQMVLLNQEAMDYYSERKNIDNLLGKNFWQVWLESDTAKAEAVCKIKGSFEDFRIHGQFRSFDNKRVALYLNPFENEDFYKSKDIEGKERWRQVARNSSIVARTDGSVPITKAMKEMSQIYKKYLPNNTTNVYSVPQLYEDSSKAPVQSYMILFFICAVLTFIIVIGVVAITKENITKRFKEIGIRMALGSSDRQILIAFFTELLLLATLASSLSGLSIFLLNEYNIASFEIGFSEYILSAVLLFSVIITSVFMPIKNASSMKPNIALHYE